MWKSHLEEPRDNNLMKQHSKTRNQSGKIFWRGTDEMQMDNSLNMHEALIKSIGNISEILASL